MRNAIIAGKCMDGLEESLTLTYLKVRDVSNVFYCVGDTQFVENRVRDEGENLHEPLEKVIFVVELFIWDFKKKVLKYKSLVLTKEFSFVKTKLS